MSKKLYYQLSDGNDVQNVVLELSGCQTWIEEDMKDYNEGDELPSYTLVPIWLSDEEFNNLPEASI